MQIATKLKQTRCPYCIDGAAFKIMTRYDEGADDWYVCASCGHLVASSNPQFKCPCDKCAGLATINGRKRM